MCRIKMNRLFLSFITTISLIFMGAGLALAAHPDIPLYTYEEVANQFGQPIMPVALDADYKGFPYSPKATCGNCHNGTLTRNDGYGPITDMAGNPLAEPLVSYADMNENTFHANMDAAMLIDAADTSSQAGKPWTQSTGMAGKW